MPVNIGQNRAEDGMAAIGQQVQLTGEAEGKPFCQGQRRNGA
jgi:hypothetical protein